jgi:hypothetical protein
MKGEVQMVENIASEKYVYKNARKLRNIIAVIL